MKKILILLLSISSVVQISAMGERPLKKQRITSPVKEAEVKEKIENHEWEIWEDYIKSFGPINKQLIDAIDKNNLELAKDAIAKGANPNLTIDCDLGENVHILRYAIDEASQKNILSNNIAKYLLSLPNINLNYIDGSGFTALFEATYSGDKEMVDLLLSHRTNPNLGVIPPITVAIEQINDASDDEDVSAYWDCINSLIKYGALITVKDSDGESLLDYAQKKHDRYFFNSRLPSRNFINWLEQQIGNIKFMQNIIAKEIEGATKLPKELASLTSEYLETYYCLTK